MSTTTMQSFMQSLHCHAKFELFHPDLIQENCNVKVLATQAGQPNNDHYTDLHSLCKSKFNKLTRKMNHLPWHVPGKSPLSVCPHVRGLMGDGEWQCYWHWKPSSLGSVSPFQLPSAETINLTIIIMYIYHALINALSADMIHINLNTIFYTHIAHSPTKTIYISVQEWGREWGKQVGSMNEESKVRGCYNITFYLCQQGNGAGSPLNQTHWCPGNSWHWKTTCFCRDTGGKRTWRA